MRKSLKIKTLATLSVFALGAGALGVGLGANTQTASAENPTFYVLNGASVRLTETPAVRFTLLMSKELYNSGLTSENVEVGAVLMPQDMLTDANGDGLDEADLNVNTQGAVVAKMAGTNDENVRFSAWVESTEVSGYMQSYVMLEGIPEESFNRPISVIGYATVDGQNYSYTENVVTRSLAGVAYELVAKEMLPEAEVSQYLTQTFAVNFFDEDGETEMANTQSLKYGETVTVPEVEKDGKIFKGWQKRIGTKDGVAVWSETLYDFNAENATFVQGNLQFRAVWADAPTAFGSIITADMFMQTQEYEGEIYEYSGKIDYVQKDGKEVAVVKTAKAGLIFSATEAFNALIPETAKDTDYIVFDLYAYDASGWLLAGVTQSSILAAKTWYTAKTTVGAWKETSKIYSNSEIAVANFRIEEVPVINAFGQTIVANKAFTNTTVTTMDGETVLKGSQNASHAATDALKALIPDTAKNTDIVTFKLYFSANSASVYGSTGWITNTWFEWGTTVEKFKTDIIWVNAVDMYIKDFAISTEAAPLTAFGNNVSLTAPFNSGSLTVKDGSLVVCTGISSTSGAKPTNDFLSLIPAEAKATDTISFDIWAQGGASVSAFGTTPAQNAWKTMTVTVEKFKTSTVWSNNAICYLKNFTCNITKPLTAFGADMDTSKTFFTNNNSAAAYDNVEKDGETVVVLKNSAGYSMIATEDFNSLIPATAKDTDYVVVDVYFYTLHWFTIGGVSYKGGSDVYGCYPAGSWQTFKCTVAEWKANSTFYTEASVGVANFRIESAS